MKPALTREEWEVEQSFPLSPGDWVEYFYDTPEDLHALAARCLHNQPFGFAHWMVSWMLTRSWGAVPRKIQDGMRTEADVDKYIADRIEALLPPEEGR